MKSVLANINLKEVVTEPFPYIAKEGGVISNDLCERLIKEYPSLDTVSKGTQLNGRPYKSNEKIRYLAKDVLTLCDVTPFVKEFVETHLSREHYNHILRLFKPQIQKLYPNLEKKLGLLESLRLGVRHIDSFDTADVLIDAELCIDTPVDELSSVKVAHLDSVRKLFVGNFYLRRPEDTSVGGSFELFKFKPGKFYFYGRRFIEDKYVEKIARVPYQSNNLACFINGLHSLHGVEVREKTEHVRYSFNFILEFKDPLFSINRYVRMTPRRLAERVYVKLRRFIGI